MMKRKRMLVMGMMMLICGVVIAATTSDAPAAEPVIKWRLAVDWPANDLQMSKAVPEFVKWVEQESKGRIKITAYSGAQLSPALESFDNVRRGTFELLQSCGAYHANKLPVAMPSFQLPMGPRGIEDYKKIYGPYGALELLRSEYRKMGVDILAMSFYGGGNVCSNKPIRSAADFQGLKIRTVGAQANLWKELGASAVFIPPTEMYLALKTGVADAFTFSNQAVDLMKFHEVTKYMICAHPMPPGKGTGAHNGGLYVNMKAFNKLPADLQDVLRRSAQKYANYTMKIYNDWDEWFMLKGGAKKLGMEVIVLSKAETLKMRKVAMEKVWPTLAKDAASKKYIEIVTKFLKDQGEL